MSTKKRVIIIGAGFAGAATAFQLLKEGFEGDRILVVDRGEPIGSKNLTGGILWGRELDDFEEFLGKHGMASGHGTKIPQIPNVLIHMLISYVISIHRLMFVMSYHYHYHFLIVPIHP